MPWTSEPATRLRGTFEKASSEIAKMIGITANPIARPTTMSGQGECQTNAVTRPAAMIATLAMASLRADRNAALVRPPLWSR